MEVKQQPGNSNGNGSQRPPTEDVPDFREIGKNLAKKDYDGAIKRGWPIEVAQQWAESTERAFNRPFLRFT